MGQNPEGLGPFPAGKGVGRESRVDDGKVGFKIGILHERKSEKKSQIVSEF